MCLMTIVADVQVGHVAALWPENFEINKGMVYKLAGHQKILLEYWKNFWRSPEVRESEYVLNLAESIEGKNRKEYGKSLITPDIDIQCDAFVSLIKPYIKDKKYFGLKGSGYHDSEDTDVEKRIAENLGGEWMGDIANLKIKKTGHIIWATHKGGDAMLYRSTMLDRNSLYFSAIKTKLEEDPDIILYGHHHKCFRVDTETRINIIAPSWCFWHPIKGAAKFPYTQPTIGGLILKLPKRRGQIEVIKKFYPLEHIYSALCNV
jgi:hypothetical protein